MLVYNVFFVSCATAYFIMGGVGTLKSERSDALVNPGVAGGHAHQFSGSSAYNIVPRTSAQLRQGFCSTFSIQDDMSVYWRPLLYFLFKDGSVESVDDGGPTIYYHFDDKENTQVFPEDFRMISGDSSLRECPKVAEGNAKKGAITFLCRGQAGGDTTYSQFPPVECEDGFRMQINFPSCWNGQDAFVPDHKSHMSFPSIDVDSGDCPAGYLRVPRIFMKFYTASAKFNGRWAEALNPGQPFVFSNGDTTGCSFHADYMFGWKGNTLANIISECDCMSADFGSTDCCEAKGIIKLDSQTAKNCHATSQIDEPVLGTFKQLPGMNKIQGVTSFTPPSPPKFMSPITQYIGNLPLGACALYEGDSFQRMKSKRAGQCFRTDTISPSTNQSSAGTNNNGFSLLPFSEPASQTVSVDPSGTYDSTFFTSAGNGNDSKTMQSSSTTSQLHIFNVILTICTAYGVLVLNGIRY